MDGRLLVVVARLRVIHDQSLPVDGVRSSVEVIDEFPFFSFLLGDLHPHVLALPFVLLAIMASLNLLIGALGLASVRLADDEGRLSHLARHRPARPRDRPPPARRR